MMHKYFIGSHPQSDGAYVIHKDVCPLAAISGRSISLGIYDSRALAEVVALTRFKKVKFCPFCIKDTEKAGAGDSSVQIFSGHFRILTKPVESALLCGVN